MDAVQTEGPEPLPPFVDVGTKVGGRYVVERILGAGGMGIVAAARYPELEQQVAIKFLRPEHAANSIVSARFLREAKLAAKVKSPHFVRVFDLGTLEGSVPYIVMEMLSGRDLSAELDERGTLNVAEAVDYVLQAAVGIAEIHALGVVHRDLKPSNLFIAETAGTRLLKVLDFGVSKENPKGEGVALTSTESLIGTPQYMSPEQIKQSKNVDTRSDLWALGVILYELLTGSPPFVSDGGAVGELFGMILFTDPVPLHRHRPDLPANLAAIVMKCMKREVAERYASIAELAEALRPFAPAGSVHRIDSVHKALAHGDPRVPVPLPSDSAITAPSPIETARKSAPTAAALALTEQAIVTGPPSPPRIAEPTTAMTSTQSTPVKRRQPVSWRSAAVVGAVVVVGAVAWMKARSPSTDPTPSAASSSSSSSVTEIAPLPAISAEPQPTTTTIAAPTTPPSASAAPLQPAPPQPATSSRPHHSAPRVSASVRTPATPAGADLLIDRK